MDPRRGTARSRERDRCRVLICEKTSGGFAEALSSQDGNAQAMVFARAAAFLTAADAETWLLIARIALDRDNPSEALRALDRISADSPVAMARRPGPGPGAAGSEADRRGGPAAEARWPTRRRTVPTPGGPGRSAARPGAFAEAEAAYTQAFSACPSSTGGNWRLLYARGISYERTQRWPQAEADLLKALELEPEQPFVLNYLGYSWVDKGLNLDRAKAMLHRAVELKPDDGYHRRQPGLGLFPPR